MQKTLVIIKPDAVQRGLVGKITSRFEDKGLKLVADKMEKLDKSILKEHYSHHIDKPFFSDLAKYMSSGPVVLQVWKWVDAIDVVRLMVGVTNSRQAQPGTIRGDFGMSLGRNIIHASDGEENAQNEIQRFFDESEIHEYEKIDQNVKYEQQDLETNEE